MPIGQTAESGVTTYTFGAAKTHETGAALARWHVLYNFAGSIRIADESKLLCVFT